MRNLYGTEHTLRGAEMDTWRYKLSRTKPEDESFQPAKKALMRLVAEEAAAVEREYEIFLQEHVTNTRAARVAATAPSHAQWAAIIRQQNSLNRQLEHKIRLLMELQRERKSEARESPEASSPPDPGDPPDGATRAQSCRPRTQAPAAANPSTTGMAQTSSCEVCDVSEGQAGMDDSIQPVPGEFGDVRHEERAITPIASGTGALLIWLGALLAAAFKEIKNRGNELKDLLQRQGITEIASSKRTHFGDCHGSPSPGRSDLTRSGVGQALPLRIRAERAAIGAPEGGVWKRCRRKRNDSVSQSSRSCLSADGHPETMKITRRWTDVARAFCPADLRPRWPCHNGRDTRLRAALRRLRRLRLNTNTVWTFDCS
jgi:hypothetical protein